MSWNSRSYPAGAASHRPRGRTAGPRCSATQRPTRAGRRPGWWRCSRSTRTVSTSSGIVRVPAALLGLPSATFAICTSLRCTLIVAASRSTSSHLNAQLAPPEAGVRDDVKRGVQPVFVQRRGTCLSAPASIASPGTGAEPPSPARRASGHRPRPCPSLDGATPLLDPPSGLISGSGACPAVRSTSAATLALTRLSRTARSAPPRASPARAAGSRRYLDRPRCLGDGETRSPSTVRCPYHGHEVLVDVDPRAT